MPSMAAVEPCRTAALRSACTACGTLPVNPYVSRFTGLSPCTMAQIPTRQHILASQKLWKHEGLVTTLNPYVAFRLWNVVCSTLCSVPCADILVHSRKTKRHAHRALGLERSAYMRTCYSTKCGENEGYFRIYLGASSS